MMLLSRASLLLQLAIPLVILFLLWRWWQGRSRAEPETPLMPSADVTRLMLASLVLRGALFRRQVLDHQRNPFRAQPAEPGLDMPLVVAAARSIEAEERAYQWGVVLLTLVVLVAPGGLRWLALLVLLGFAIYLQHRQRFVLAPAFRREGYDAAAMRSRFGVTAAEPVAPGSVPVLVSATGQPFVGLGVTLGNWNVAMDVTRPAHDRGHAPDAVPPPELESRIAQSLRRLNIPRLRLGEELFVSGVETTRTPGVQPDAYSRPLAVVSESDARPFRNVADPRARAYQVAQIRDWDGEIVLTYLFRVVARGAMLSVETVSLGLGPVARAYREIDALRVMDGLALLGWGLASLVSTPLVIIGAFASLLGQVSEALDQMLGGEEARQRNEIRTNPAYNYGARWSLREHVADTRGSWFQRSDLVQYLRALDAQILNTVKDVLREAGVDASSVDDQAAVIQTTNVTVAAGGQINGMAVGSGNRVAAAVPRAQ